MISYVLLIAGIVLVLFGADRLTEGDEHRFLCRDAIRHAIDKHSCFGSLAQSRILAYPNRKGIGSASHADSKMG